MDLTEYFVKWREKTAKSKRLPRLVQILPTDTEYHKAVKRVVNRRIIYGLSASDIGNALGLSKQTLCLFETCGNSRPMYTHLYAITYILDEYQKWIQKGEAEEELLRRLYEKDVSSRRNHRGDADRGDGG